MVQPGLAATAKSKPVRPLYDSSALLCRGQMSAGDAASIPNGFMRFIKNFRLGGRMFKVRLGASKLTSSAVTLTGTITWLGRQHVVLNGTEYLVCAAHGTSSGYAAVFTVNLSTWAFTEITSGSGKYGNTRLGDYTDPVSFAVWSDPDKEKDYLIIANGQVPNRIWDPADSVMAIHEGIPIPRQIGNYAYFGNTDHFKVYNVSHTFTNSAGTHMTLADDASPANYILLTVNDNVANGDNSKTNGALVGSGGGAVDATASGSEARQLWIWGEGDSSIWQYIKLEISEDASTWNVVHDPSSPTGRTSSGIVITDSGNDRHILWCTIEHIDSSQLNGLQHVRVTYVGDTLSGGGTALYTYKIIGMIFGGQIPASAKYAKAFFNTGSRAESAGTVFPPSAHRGYYLSSMGGKYAYELPLSPDLYCKVNLQIEPAPPSVRDAACDYAVIYRIDPATPAETEFTFVREVKQSTYSGSWAYDSGSFFTATSFYDNLKSAHRPGKRRMRLPDDLAIPICRVISTIGERLWCADVLEAQRTTIIACSKAANAVLGVSTAMGWRPGMFITISGATGGSAAWLALNGTFRILAVDVLPTGNNNITIDLDTSGFSNTYTGSTGTGIGPRRRGDGYFSWFQEFTLFSKTARLTATGRLNENSASYFIIQGQQIQKFEGMSIYGIDHLNVWTNRDLFFTGGTLTSELQRMQYQGPLGTEAPRSVVRSGLEVYWIDWKRQVRRMVTGQPVLIARNIVDDRLLDSPDITKAYGAIFHEAYHLAYKPEAGTYNERSLVFDERTSELLGDGAGWCEDYFPTNMTGELMLSSVISGTEKLLTFSADGHIYRHDHSETGDLGTNPIAVAFTLREVAAGNSMFGNAIWHRVIIHMDVDDGAELAISKTSKPNQATTYTGVISLDAPVDAPSATQVYRAEQLTSSDALSARGNACQIAATGNLSPGKSIYFIGVEEQTAETLKFDVSPE